MKLLIFVKNIEGGTGTFAFSFQKLQKLFFKRKIFIRYLVIEKPKYFVPPSKDIHFFRKKKYNNNLYSVTPQTIIVFIKELFWVSRKIGQFKPHIILSVDIHCNLLLIIAKLSSFRKTPLILTTHINLEATLAQKSTKLLYIILKQMVRIFYSQADIIVCVSKGVTRQLTQVFNLKNVITIYNGVPPINSSSSISQKGKRIIMTAARLDPQKDYESLIEAFNIVYKQYSNCELWIGGEGPLKQRLKTLVAKLGLTKQVRFLGWVKPSLYIPKAEVFILSSKREGFPVALLEAMSYAKPVISTDAPFGPSEILDKGKYGILTPIGDENALKEAILNLLTNQKKYASFAKKAFERSLFFSEDKMLRKYKSLIKKLLRESAQYPY